MIAYLKASAKLHRFFTEGCIQSRRLLRTPSSFDRLFAFIFILNHFSTTSLPADWVQATSLITAKGDGSQLANKLAKVLLFQTVTKREMKVPGFADRSCK
jgi:hypothetical protein